MAIMETAKLPIYLLVDVSQSMEGKSVEGDSLETVNGILLDLLSKLTPNDYLFASYSAWTTFLPYISVITFSDDAQQIVPLTPIEKFELPHFTLGGESNLNVALECLCTCYQRDLKQKPAWETSKPIVIIFSDHLDEKYVNDSQLQKTILKVFHKEWWEIVTIYTGGDFDISIRGFDHFGFHDYYAVEIEDVAPYLINCLNRHHDLAFAYDLPSYAMDFYMFRFVFFRDKDLFYPQMSVYFLVDASTTMPKESVALIRSSLMDLLEDLDLYSNSNQMGDFLRSSVILCNESARQITPLQEVSKSYYIPEFPSGGQLCLPTAIQTLCDCLKKEQDSIDGESQDYFPPLVIFFSNGSANVLDNAALEQAIERLRTFKVHRLIGCLVQDSSSNAPQDINMFESCGCDLVVEFSKLEALFNDLLSRETTLKPPMQGVLYSKSCSSSPEAPAPEG